MPFETFFDTIKAGTYSSIKRVFVTGDSPVTLDDLTSGFNIGTDYSLDYAFHKMVGDHICTDMEHSYIIELKYPRSQATDMAACEEI